MEIVSRRRFELGNEVEVEVPRYGGLGVDEQTPAPDLGAEPGRSTDYILQETGSESPALVPNGDTEPREQSGRLRIATCSFAQS